MMRSYVDPGIEPRSNRDADLLRLIARRAGMRLERHGAGLLLRGPGVHVVAADLASFSSADLAAPSHAEILTRARMLGTVAG